MKPKFGNITNPGIFLLRDIITVSKLGFDYAEIAVEGPGATPEIIISNKSKVLDLLKKFDYDPIVHTPWWIELGSEYEPVRRGWIEEGKEIIKVAKILGAKLVNFHATSRGMYFKIKTGKEIVMENMAKSLRELIKFAKDYDIEIMLENVPGDDGVSDVNDYEILLEEVKGLKLHLDVGHAFIKKGMQHIQDYIKNFEEKLVHIHVSDNHGKGDEHLPLGLGSINFKEVARTLKKIEYDKTITFEVFGENRIYAKKSMEYFKELWSQVNF